MLEKKAHDQPHWSSAETIEPFAERQHPKQPITPLTDPEQTILSQSSPTLITSLTDKSVDYIRHKNLMQIRIHKQVQSCWYLSQNMTLDAPLHFLSLCLMHLTNMHD